MGLNSPVPVRLNEECKKAAKILNSFVDGSNNGLDKVVPRHVLEHAKGFAIFTVVKAGFLVSARAGSGVVIAKLPNGEWSAPSAIGTAGVGFGGQAGAEVTDFLIILNSRSAVQQFMSAGSLNLGGNMSLAVGPLGRNAEGMGGVNSKGKVAAMYSYSKTKGLFGGVSLEGSVIVERQDANRIAYGSSVTSKQLLSGTIEPPPFAEPLISKIIASTGLPGGQTWIDDAPRDSPGLDEFGSSVGPNDNRFVSWSSSTPPPRSPIGYGFQGIGSTAEPTSRSRSGSLLGGSRKRGDSISKVAAADIGGGSNGNSGRSSPGPRPPGMFAALSGGGRKRAGSKASNAGGGLPDDMYASSEDYNAGGAGLVAASNSPAKSPQPFTSSGGSDSYFPPTPTDTSGYLTAPRAAAKPSFETHFESNVSSEDLLADTVEPTGTSKRATMDPDLIGWDERSSRGASPLPPPSAPSSYREGGSGPGALPGKSNWAYQGRRRGNSSASGSALGSPMEERDEDPFSVAAASGGGSSTSGTGSRSSKSSRRPSLSSRLSSGLNLTALGRNKAKPQSTYITSSSSWGDEGYDVPRRLDDEVRERRRNDGDNEEFGLYGERVDNSYGASSGPLAQEDWGSLGEKARQGINRTRSGSDGVLLTSTYAANGSGNSSGKNSPAILTPKKGLGEALPEGIKARAIALFDYQGQEAGDLSFKKGDVIFITKMTKKQQDWWTGKVLPSRTTPGNIEGIFPANFCELVS